MNGKWILIALLVPLLILNGWYFYCYYDVSGRIQFAHQFSQIRNGMTYTQVIGLLGQPEHNSKEVSSLKKTGQETPPRYPTYAGYGCGEVWFNNNEGTVTGFRSNYWNPRGSWTTVYTQDGDAAAHNFFVITLFAIPLLASLFFLRWSRFHSFPSPQY